MLTSRQGHTAELRRQRTFKWPWSSGGRLERLHITVGSQGELTETRKWTEAPAPTAVNYAEGLAPDEVLLRQERALMMAGVAVGGTLTLTNQRLVWCRSRWSSLAFVDWGRQLLQVELATSACARNAWRFPGWDVFLSLCGPSPVGIIGAIITSRFGILLGLINLVGLLLAGAFRRTLSVRFRDGEFYFVVQDLDGLAGRFERDIERRVVGNHEPVVVRSSGAKWLCRACGFLLTCCDP